MTEKHLCLTCEHFGMQNGPTGCKVGLSTDYRTQCLSHWPAHWPRSRGTTQGELIRMHQEAEAQDNKPPKHYDLGGGKDIHDIERAIWGDEAHAKHLLMAAFEYIARAHKKGSNIEDISKAINCLEKAKRIMTESGK